MSSPIDKLRSEFGQLRNLLTPQATPELQSGKVKQDIHVQIVQNGDKITYNGKTYTVNLVQNGKEKTLDAEAVKRVVKILKAAEFDQDVKDLEHTTIFNNEVKIGDQVVSAAQSSPRITKLFDRVITPRPSKAERHETAEEKKKNLSHAQSQAQLRFAPQDETTKVKDKKPPVSEPIQIPRSPGSTQTISRETVVGRPRLKRLQEEQSTLKAKLESQKQRAAEDAGKTSSKPKDATEPKSVASSKEKQTVSEETKKLTSQIEDTNKKIKANQKISKEAEAELAKLNKEEEALSAARLARLKASNDKTSPKSPDVPKVEKKGKDTPVNQEP